MLKGTWIADSTHSSLCFAVRHMLVATFRGDVRDFEARLLGENGRVALIGSARVASISTREEAVARQLLGPEFFDAARHPKIRLAGRDLGIHAGKVAGAAELTIRGLTRPIELRGSAAGPVLDPFGAGRVGLDLVATIDRREWGIDWNARLPDGGLVLSNEVDLFAHLELVEEGEP